VRRFAELRELQAMVGREIGLSDWTTIDQSRIDRFAETTGDRQWIHVDPARAANGPFGSTIAHGFLTLSLLPALTANAFEIADVRMGVNYGLNRVRFTAPVPCGSRVRGRFVLREYLPIEGGAQFTIEATVELEGSSKPACVAETLSRRFT
jgi:acyl dehydratase